MTGGFCSAGDLQEPVKRESRLARSPFKSSRLILLVCCSTFFNVECFHVALTHYHSRQTVACVCSIHSHQASLVLQTTYFPCMSRVSVKACCSQPCDRPELVALHKWSGEASHPSDKETVLLSSPHMKQPSAVVSLTVSRRRSRTLLTHHPCPNYDPPPPVPDPTRSANPQP